MAADNSLVKKAHTEETFTEEQIADLMKCMDPHEGYLYFAKNFAYVQHPVRGRLLFEPYEYQLRLMHSYHDYRFNINLMPRQTGKALALDTPIPTPTGWTTMGDVRAGDKILGPDGKETAVTFATEVMHDHTCYAVTFDTGETIVADAEHLWEVDLGANSSSKVTKTTEEIKKHIEATQAQVYIHSADELKTSHAQLPVDPYTLGVQLADARSALTNQQIPIVYLRAAVSQRVDLLQGLMDTAGAFDSDLGNYTFSQTNAVLAEQVRELLASLGIKNHCSTQLIDNQLHYIISFATTKHNVFRLYKNSQDRDTIAHCQTHTRHYITSIELTGSVPVRCIQVDNDTHLFLCGKSMIPTHNTTCAAIYLTWYAMFHPDQTILIAAHKYTGAQEIMQRIRYVYESCPDHIRAGVTSYNKGSIEFENGSRIVSQTTTGNTGRGMSISLLYCLDGDTTKVTVRNKHTLIEEEVTLVELYGKLTGADRVLT
jgi:hypothetical protein